MSSGAFDSHSFLKQTTDNVNVHFFPPKERKDDAYLADLTLFPFGSVVSYIRDPPLFMDYPFP